MGDQWELYNQGCIGGPMRWGANENRVERVTLGDQWDGGPMRTGYKGWQWGTNEMGDQWNGWCMGANWGTNEMGDWWVGGPMRWGTNEMGDQWDGGPLGLADDGVTNEKGDQWDGGPVIWGTNEMGDQWAPIMYWGTNELGDQWEGDQWDGGPMRWGTSERIPSYYMQNHIMLDPRESLGPFSGSLLNIFFLDLSSQIYWPVWKKFVIYNFKYFSCDKQLYNRLCLSFHLFISVLVCHRTVRSVAPYLFDWFTPCLAQIQPMRWWCAVHHFQMNRSKARGTWFICILKMLAFGC